MTVPAAEILLAEDTLEHAQLALHAFRLHHMTNEVHVVGEGRQVLDFLMRKGDYADREPAEGGRLVLLDLGLPDISGFDVLGRIRANPETKSVPVIVLTASNAGDDIRESFRLGADAYIVKPVTFQAFLDAARHLGFAWTMVAGQRPGEGS